MRFSQRMKITPIKSVLQIDSMDDDLRNTLWNVLDLVVLEPLQGSMEELQFCRILWAHYFKLPLDKMPWKGDLRRDRIRSHFFSVDWYEAYDFLEFMAQEDPSSTEPKFVDTCNAVLERELSGFRFVGNQLTPITDDSELETIGEAIKRAQTNRFTGVEAHLVSALEKLSDRKNPDYRNSIKESISAVEAISQIIAGNSKAELGQALKLIEDKLGLHPALKKGFLAIYGYTSDADGIRHAMVEQSSCDFADAKYMLVSCSAFINYLILKTTQSGLF